MTTTESEATLREHGGVIHAWKLVVHIFVGTAVFAIVVVAAAGLDRLAAWLEWMGTATYIVFGTRVMEGVIFAVDLITYAWFLVKSAWRLIREL